MALAHAAPGEVIDVRPLSGAIPSSSTKTLIKTERLEVIRLVLPAGKVIPSHKVAGEITVQCLEGCVEFTTSRGPRIIESGEMLYLSGDEEHALKGLEDASVLVTILL